MPYLLLCMFFSLCGGLGLGYAGGVLVGRSIGRAMGIREAADALNAKSDGAPVIRARTRRAAHRAALNAKE